MSSTENNMANRGAAVDKLYLNDLRNHGRITADNFAQRVYLEGYLKRDAVAHDLITTKAVFIFPGNMKMHHQLVFKDRKKQQLSADASTVKSDSKKGGGLAKAASQISKNGSHVLSLPTQSGGPTYMDNTMADNPYMYQVVEEAVAHMWLMLGAGYNLVLPVRIHACPAFFPLPLCNLQGAQLGDKVEPAFWGNNNRKSAPTLAKFYTDALQDIAKFQGVRDLEQNSRVKAVGQAPNSMPDWWGTEKKPSTNVLSPTQAFELGKAIHKARESKAQAIVPGAPMPRLCALGDGESIQSRVTEYQAKLQAWSQEQAEKASEPSGGVLWRGFLYVVSFRWLIDVVRFLYRKASGSGYAGNEKVEMKPADEFDNTSGTKAHGGDGDVPALGPEDQPQSNPTGMGLD